MGVVIQPEGIIGKWLVAGLAKIACLGRQRKTMKMTANYGQRMPEKLARIAQKWSEKLAQCELSGKSVVFRLKIAGNNVNSNAF